ncbi:MAG: quinoprotein dehydrogenase-associated putative ABC transporter substrate-binding protein [Rhodospirillales bacterium]
MSGTAWWVAASLLAAAGMGRAARADEAPAAAPPPVDKVSHTELRVCADPSNLPYSNDKQEGFENKIAQRVAQDLGETLSFTWFPDSQGFARATLFRRRCDVIIGTVEDAPDLRTTKPYYQSGYVLVSRTADNIKSTSLGDPALQGARFGLIASTPPTDLLLQHNLLARTHFYPLVVDTRVDQPAHQMLLDVVDKTIDVGLAWAPVAGYYIKHDHLKLTTVPLDPENRKFFRIKIAMGVRPSDKLFMARLNDVLAKDKPAIDKILADYGIPLFDK